MEKVALVVFNGDPMCFIHVLLNALDMAAGQVEARIVIEGAATQLLPELEKEDNFLHGLWEKVKAAGLVDGVCKACSNKMGTLATARKLGFTLLDEMSGHPSLSRYRREGYEIITF